MEDDALDLQGGKYEGEISSTPTGSPCVEYDDDEITGSEKMSYGDVIRKDGSGGVGDIDAKGEKGEASWAPWFWLWPKESVSGSGEDKDDIQVPYYTYPFSTRL